MTSIASDMPAKTTQVAFRLPTDLLARLDRLAETMRRAQPGLSVTRTDVVRMLLNQALEVADVEPRPRKRR